MIRETAVPLVITVSAAWAVVWFVTSVLASPPLASRWVVLAGVAVTNALILGFGSVLRGPRRGRGTRGLREDGEPLAIAGPRMAYLRDGLTSRTAIRTAERLRQMLEADAVAITDADQMLAFVGAGSDHHTPGSPLYSPLRQQVLATGRTVVGDGRALGCPREDCPLGSAVIAPLRVRDTIVGTVTVYATTPRPPRAELVDGMAGILSLHLELADLDRERSLNADARLDALRAQINPHFLFNTLNTIASKTRTDGEEARQLLLRLADFFRYAIDQQGHFAEFAQEYFFVRTYMALEQARFGDRLVVRYDVDPQVLSAEVPVLTIQPLVENAVKHGVSKKVGRGTVSLKARVDPLGRNVDIRVRDDGVGMEPERLDAALRGEARGDGTGVGLTNISDRLVALYGDRFTFEVRSSPGDGTEVRMRIPMR